MTPKPFPPVGKRNYYEQRESVLAAVADIAGDKGARVVDLAAHMGDEVPALLTWHLLLLGDAGKVEWVGDEPERRVRLRKDAP